MSMKRNDPKFEQAYERAALRAAFVSLFWAVISERKKLLEGFTLLGLAKAIGSSKYEVSRWFNGDPNWTVNTIANIAHALGTDLLIQARERSTGRIFTPAGVVAPVTQMIPEPLKPVTETLRTPQSATVKSNDPNMKVELAA